MIITEGFVKRMIKEHFNIFEGKYFIIQLRCLSNERIIGKLSKLNDGKITFKDMYKIEDNTYVRFSDEDTFDLEDVHIFNPTSVQIYGFFAFKNKEAEEENRKNIITPFDHAIAMLSGLHITENSVYGDFGSDNVNLSIK